MRRIFKYLKPYALATVISFLVLAVGAVCDLMMPNYMSKIVDVGLQQGGIESAVVAAADEDTMDCVMMFLDGNQKTAALNAYTFADADKTSYALYAAKYPGLNGKSVYALRASATEEQKEALSDPFARAFAGLATLEIALSDRQKGEDGIPSEKDQSDTGAEEEITLPQEIGAFIDYCVSNEPGDTLTAALKAYPQAQSVVSAAEKLLDERLKQADASELLQTAIPAIQQSNAQLGLSAKDVQQNYIWQNGAMMLLFAAGNTISAICVGYLASRISAGFARDLRSKLFTQVQKFSGAEFDKFSTASLITRTTNDVTQIQMTVMMMLRMVLYAPLLGFGGIFMALQMSVAMSWIIALAVGILLGLVLFVFKVALPKIKIMQSLVDRINLVMRESLTGLLVVRAFDRQKFEEKRFDTANQNLTKNQLFVGRIMVIMYPAMTLIMNGVSVLIIWVGARQIADSSMQVGNMMAFMQYVTLIVMSFLVMSMMFIMLPRASVSANRVADVIETQPSINDPKDPKTFPSKSGRLEFKNVCFKYPGAEHNVLSNLDFTAEPGKTTAFIGSTGSGKSTVANLIPRFYDVTEGQVLLDGVDVRDVTLEDLRDQIGYVPQKSVLFSGTIASNLRLGDEDATMRRLERAAKDAQALDFIEQKENGFESHISQGGSNVSGGQKQRLSIARALVKDPNVYIFDDSFSALDFKTDAALRAAIAEQTKDKTVLLIAQRVGTIMNAEQIIVLDEGRIVGKGTHRELMKNCKEYREIALTQFSEEELENEQ